MSGEAPGSSRPVRLGVVSYLNVAPLVYGLDADPGFRLEPDVPSRVADRLHAGEIELGMIPSIEYRPSEYAVVPGLGIASRGPVRSVLLFHRKPLESIERVALDTSSRTSVALLRILLRDRLGREPEYVPRAPRLSEMLEVGDAALLIGDAALYETSELPRLDLGEAWTAQTGLPFVWAFWAGRPGALRPGDVGRLQAALDAGLGAIPAIASSYNGAGRERSALNEVYLRSHIAFRMGEAELEGLELFYGRAHRHGLIDEIPAIQFYEHS